MVKLWRHINVIESYLIVNDWCVRDLLLILNVMFIVLHSRSAEMFSRSVCGISRLSRGARFRLVRAGREDGWRLSGAGCRDTRGKAAVLFPIWVKRLRLQMAAPIWIPTCMRRDWDMRSRKQRFPGTNGGGTENRLQLSHRNRNCS